VSVTTQPCALTKNFQTKKMRQSAVLFLLVLSIIIVVVSATPRCAMVMRSQEVVVDNCRTGMGPKGIQCKYGCSKVCTCTKGTKGDPPTFDVVLPTNYMSCKKFSLSAMFNKESSRKQALLASSVKAQCEKTQLCKCPNLSYVTAPPVPRKTGLV